MSYLPQFKEILVHVIKEDRTQNQLLGDLHLSLEKIKDELKNLHDDYQKLISKENNISSHSLKMLRAIEYNSALMLSMLSPPNIIEILNKALIEERYYYFFTVSEILLNSKINSETKNRLKNLVAVVRNQFNLTQVDDKYTKLELIQNITQKLLNAALSDWEVWENSTKEVIKELLNSKSVATSDVMRKINFEDILLL